MAHRAFRGRSVGISEAQRRKKSWFALSDASLATEPNGFSLTAPGLVAAGESQQALIFGTNTNPTFAESTILRIRGYVDVPKSTDAGPTLRNVFAFGICVLPELSAQVLNGVPNPATVQGQDWDGWMFLRVSTQVPLDAVGTMMDVKAMRKLKSGDALVLIAGLATDNPAGANGLPILGGLRGLFLLP